MGIKSKRIAGASMSMNLERSNYPWEGRTIRTAGTSGAADLCMNHADLLNRVKH